MVLTRNNQFSLVPGTAQSFKLGMSIIEFINLQHSEGPSGLSRSLNLLQKLKACGLQEEIWPKGQSEMKKGWENSYIET